MELTVNTVINANGSVTAIINFTTIEAYEELHKVSPWLLKPITDTINHDDIANNIIERMHAQLFDIYKVITGGDIKEVDQEIVTGYELRFLTKWAEKEFSDDSAMTRLMEDLGCETAQAAIAEYNNITELYNLTNKIIEGNFNAIIDELINELDTKEGCSSFDKLLTSLSVLSFILMGAGNKIDELDSYRAIVIEIAEITKQIIANIGSVDALSLVKVPDNTICKYFMIRYNMSEDTSILDIIRIVTKIINEVDSE